MRVSYEVCFVVFNVEYIYGGTSIGVEKPGTFQNSRDESVKCGTELGGYLSTLAG